VALALRAEGFEGAIPSGYALRSGDAVRVRDAIAAAGLIESGGAPGDLLLLRTGPGQLHLAISTGAGLVHADAMLRRVVERPDTRWPVIGRWRVPSTVIPAKAGTHLLPMPRTQPP
jgi:hypothetical protein